MLGGEINDEVSRQEIQDLSAAHNDSFSRQGDDVTKMDGFFLSTSWLRSHSSPLDELDLLGSGNLLVNGDPRMKRSSR